MRILVIGLYFADNLGDAVICDCTKALLKRIVPDAQIDLCDFTDRNAFAPPKETSLRRQKEAQKKIRARSLVSRFTPWDKEYTHERYVLQLNENHIEACCGKDYDLVVFGGGQIFMDYLGLFVHGYITRFAEKETPILIFAGGVGPSDSPGVRRKLSEALNNPYVRWISCRDNVDYVDHLLKSGKKAALISDPALWCSDVYGISRQENAQEVGLGMMFANSLPVSRVIKFWIHLIRLLDQENIPWKIFVNGSGNDVAFAREVFKKAASTSKRFEEYLAPVPRKPEELVSLISGFRSIISFRLHSHIIAASLGIPSVAITWDEKLRFFFRCMHHEERCFSIHSTPEGVIEGLKRAEREGVDLSLIARNRLASAHLLAENVRNVISSETHDSSDR
jgi:polysaccharide pyruvyl transferase WcaK-like protein